MHESSPHLVVFSHLYCTFNVLVAPHLNVINPSPCSSSLLPFAFYREHCILLFCVCHFACWRNKDVHKIKITSYMSKTFWNKYYNTVIHTRIYKPSRSDRNRKTFITSHIAVTNHVSKHVEHGRLTWAAPAGSICV